MKTIYTLNIDNHIPEITALTFPLIRRYAEKIGAGFQIINKRKFPEFPITYEKLQIYELGKKNEWNLHIDSDCLIHPDTPDFTEHINKDTVVFHGKDQASIRWKFDNYFRRDGRNIGTCSWFVISSDWTHDLWKPLTSQDPPKEAIMSRIYPTNAEVQAGLWDKGHLFDDYVISRNLARYGLKHKTIRDNLLPELNMQDCGFFFHEYLITPQKKLEAIQNTIKLWDLKK